MQEQFFLFKKLGFKSEGLDRAKDLRWRCIYVLLLIADRYDKDMNFCSGAERKMNFLDVPVQTDGMNQTYITKTKE